MEDEKRFLAITANKAGKYHKKADQILVEAFSRRGLELEFYYFNEDTDKLRNKINQALDAGYRSFLSVGGDGTVGLLASSLYNKPHRIGIIPTGTVNAIARAIGVPLVLEKAAEIAATSHNIRKIDAMEMKNRLFILNASVGVSSVSLSGVSAEHKSRYGILSYLMGLVRNSSRISNNNYWIQIDENRYSLKAVEIMVTNTGFLGLPRYRVYNGSHIDDGLVEVLTLPRWSFREVFNATLDVTVRREKRGIRLIGKGQEVIIGSTSPLPVQVDGDIIEQTPVKISVLPQAINFIVP